LSMPNGKMSRYGYFVLPDLARSMVTFVPPCYPSGPFPPCHSDGKLDLGESMGSGSMDMDQRRDNRTKAVLPVRVKGRDSSGKSFEDLVHTLDVTPAGVRLGSVRHPLKLSDEVTVFFRQRRIQFRVVWTKKLEGTSEFQVGLQAVTHDSEPWGLNLTDYRRQPASQCAAARTANAS
jgi:hypothetical protein